MKKIFTLGTDLRSEEDFIEILASYNIQALIDVRSYPRSKINIYCKKELEELLKKQNIDYYFLGKELGGFRKGGYKAYTLTEKFKEGVEILESIAISKISVIVCAEKFPWKCHRKWIALELQRIGWEVLHIIDKDKIWSPAYRLKY